VLVEALTKILERLATIEVRMILFSISNYSRSLMVMSMSSTPSAKMLKKFVRRRYVCVSLFKCVVMFVFKKTIVIIYFYMRHLEC